jgi:hypothetical protein
MRSELKTLPATFPATSLSEAALAAPLTHEYASMADREAEVAA